MSVHKKAMPLKRHGFLKKRKYFIPYLVQAI